MIQDRRLFDKYLSKTKRVNIPVPAFDLIDWKEDEEKNETLSKIKSFFAKPFGIPGLPPKYLIGRDRLIEKLQNWLTDKNEESGSYLITGYRGMGKTSFVNRVLDELIREPAIWENLLGYLVFLAAIIVGIMGHFWISLLVVIIFVILYRFIFKKRYDYIDNKRKAAFLNDVQNIFQKKYNNETSKIKSSDLSGASNKKKKTNRKKISHSEILKNLKPKEWERINRSIHHEVYRQKRFDRISVNINLGQEILNEREILCVLVSQLYNKYKRFVLSPMSSPFIWFLYSLLIPGTFILLQKLFDCLLKNSFWHWLYIPATIICTILLVEYFLYAINSRVYSILHQLKVLNKRINAALTYEASIRAGYQSSSVSTGHSYSYPIATTREIESQLIDLLARIAKIYGHPQIYFVFDELDKIEVPHKASDDPQPEFSNERYLSGGGTSRKRKTTILHLLGNLKFFTSTAKAKFIFIAGREMYDAYLADMTDRESAISSLFNGIIYVESFCKNEKSEKDVMYNTETFIARQLIPHSYIKETVINRYIECKLKSGNEANNEGDMYANIDINLKLYYKYLTTSYSSILLKAKSGDNGNKDGISESIRKLNDVREVIDKVIILLYHFTFYLYHISNGSPKKMRLNFGNYIRPLKDQEEFLLSSQNVNNPLKSMDVDIHIGQKCSHLLSFGEKEQRTIGFVHYVSFPVTQIFTDANQYGDKLLVSASFLMNHIYKYHSGGFSWRNIEQTPELLEVYRIPEFRGFIDSILNFLLQTHIIKIPCGLYQYKFRKHIAEEISLASKISEEISAIFNFTLDESQAVKRHYLELQKKHVEELNDEGISSPHSITGIHHILGDLYMADEEYNNAILEYQTALSAISPLLQDRDNKNSSEPTIMLAYIRYMLKLGAAYEKRRTYSSAYSTYYEIINRLFHYREFKEGEFGLDYGIKKNLNGLITKWFYADKKMERNRKTHHHMTLSLPFGNKFLRS